MTTRMLAQDEFVCRNSHRLRSHDFIAQRIADYAVLVNPGFVRKRIAPDNCLVRLYAEADNLREQLTGRVDFAGIYAGFKRQAISAHAHGHHNLFQRSVSSALANTVDGAFDLPRSGFNSGKTIRYGQAEIVMTVDADRDVFAISDDSFSHGPDELRKFIGESVSDRIRHVEYRGACFNGDAENFAQIVYVAAGCVFGGKLDFVSEVSRQAHGLAGHLDYFGARLFQLVLQMNVGSGNEGMNARARSVAQSFGGAPNIRLGSSTQCGYSHVAALSGYCFDRCKVPI